MALSVLKRLRNSSLESLLRKVYAGFARFRGKLTDRLRETLFPLRVHHITGPRNVVSGKDTLIVVCLVRDGITYLNEFVEHYRNLGAKHIVIMDNGSTDGTVEQAATFDRVTVLSTSAPYRQYKSTIKRYLIRRFGHNGWVLCVDIDEFFDYPFRDRIPLQLLLTYLHTHRFDAVVTHMLDLFPQGVLLEKDLPRSAHRYFDLSALEPSSYKERYRSQNLVPGEDFPVYSGGIRATVFDTPVYLTKHPLLFPSPQIRYLTSHSVSGARVADFTAVLLHYKYLGPFYAYAQRIMKEQGFFQNSEEYRRYLEVLSKDPELRLMSDNARELKSIDQLVDEGFLVVSENYRQLAENADTKR